MNLVYKILLFLLLVISLPVGKLFEIFNWNDRIIRTEIVFDKQRIESKGRICYFEKIAKDIKRKFSIYLSAKSDFAVIERITNQKNLLSLSTQNKKINSIATLLISRFVFNISYLDDSEYEFLIFS